ncbi:unnamed protein product [Phyllotreta striolata]|uniref:Uncharacterized protein n=1 Tax=Phyllotreta striolata TaxID=444603 RepID=A0A9N9TM12_PHYSR|nr:unnamed protein product [Phyllotreta striolata]
MDVRLETYRIERKMLNYFIILFGILHVEGNIIYTDRNVNELDKNGTDSEEYHLEYVLMDGEHPCKRNCESGAPPMICRYKFEVESYHTLSKACFDCPFNVTDCFRKDCVPADGTKRAIVTINRQMPGPPIEVCQNDVIVVDVHNKLASEGTTIHWHGQHQVSTPYMDGVPFITQCPIPPHTTFRYTFKATQAGTHFYHSHIGVQRCDGAYGPLIVRVPEEKDPHIGLYDYDLTDHVMVLADWASQLGTEVFMSHHHNDGDNKPPTMLVNGLGRFREFNGTGDGPIYTPSARFSVEQGYRYRFRVINAGFLNCPIEMTVDGHTIHVISSDGNDINATSATSLVTYAGERFDFIVNADQPKGLYWIRFKGLMDCDERFTKAFQVAVLQYEGGSANETLLNMYPLEEVTYDNAHVDGLQINPLNVGTEGNESFVTMPELESMVPWDDSLKEVADYQFYIAYDFYKISNREFYKPPHYGYFSIQNSKQKVLTPQFNHISMEMPSFPLLPQRDEITDDMFCNSETMKERNCTEDYCSCMHGLKVPLGAVVELVFLDEGVAYDANHPLHLHGYSFRVVALERLGNTTTIEEIKNADARGLVKRNLKNPPVKDTITVPDGGYTIVRFKATNPGYWFFHCHLEFHAEIGMALVLQVGEKDEMLPVPKNFPRCGSYQPDPFESISNSQKSAAAIRRLSVIAVCLVVFLIFSLVN